MAIVQDAFVVPPEIMEKLLTGEYRRIGGVVRCAVGLEKGQLVKFLEPIELKPDENVQGTSMNGLQFIKDHETGLFIGVVALACATVASVAGIIYYKVKTHKSEAVTNFYSALEEYINEIQKGDLELVTINTLMASLEELQNDKSYEKFKIKLSTKEIGVLVGQIYDYTIQLAANNNVDMTEQERSRTDNPILNLQNYLKAQKRIFEIGA